MTEEEMKHQELKHKARYAADTIIAAEHHKNDKDLAPHLENELKERAKHLKAAMSTKKAPAPKKEVAKKSAPSKKSSNKKK